MKRIRLIGVAAVILGSFQIMAARDFFFGLTSHGSNFWFNPTQVPIVLINSLIGGGTYSTGYDWITVKDDQGSLDVNNGNYFGFRAVDIFNNFGYGVQFGYQPAYSIFGAWINAGYKYRQFRMQPDRTIEETEKYKVHGWNVGVGIRLTPFRSLLENGKVCPFIDFGTAYNNVFSVSAPYDNARDQFGKGMSTTIGLGIRRVAWDDSSWNLSLSFIMPQYNYFNKDFTTPDGLKPYENIKSKNYSIYLKFAREF